MREQTLTITKTSREIFVAYPYRRYPPDDYRRPFLEVAKALQVTFVFADEQFSATYLLEKLRAMIASAEFGIYDVTGWNPNVAFELGLAMGSNEKCFITFNPTVEGMTEVPSDIRGRDRIEYGSLSEYQEKLERLINSQLPIPAREPRIQLDDYREQLLQVLRDDSGLRISDIAATLGISRDLAQLLIKPLVLSGRVRTSGATRAMRYFKQ